MFAVAAVTTSMQLSALPASASSQVELSTLNCSIQNTSNLSPPTAQVFEAPATGTISEISVQLYDGSPSDVLISILDATGGIPAGTPGSPANALATGTIPQASIPSAFPGLVVPVSLTNSVDVVAGQTYAILFGKPNDAYGGVSLSAIIPTFQQGNCSTDTGGMIHYWNSSSSSWDTLFTGDSLFFAVSVTVTGGTTSADSRPSPWLKALGREAGEQCPEGMNPSWAMWPNDGTGGFTCEWREEYTGNFMWTERPGFYD